MSGSPRCPWEVSAVPADYPCMPVTRDYAHTHLGCAPVYCGSRAGRWHVGVGCGAVWVVGSSAASRVSRRPAWRIPGHLLWGVPTVVLRKIDFSITAGGGNVPEQHEFAAGRTREPCPEQHEFAAGRTREPCTAAKAVYRSAMRVRSAAPAPAMGHRWCYSAIDDPSLGPPSAPGGEHQPRVDLASHEP